VNPIQYIFGDAGARSNLGKSATVVAAILGLSFPGNIKATTLPSGAVGGTSTNNTTTLPLQAVPEPQTWVIAFAGLGTLIAMQRFRRLRTTRKP